MPGAGIPEFMGRQPAFGHSAPTTVVAPAQATWVDDIANALDSYFKAHYSTSDFTSALKQLTLYGTPPREGVRSCHRTSRGIHARLMARPLRIEFPGAVYHVTSQLSYLDTRLILERLVRALHHFRPTSVQVSALSPPKRVGQFRDGRHHWGESHPGRRPDPLEPVEQTDSPLAHRHLWLLARLHG